MNRHQLEVEYNAAAWKRKPLLRAVYGEFYRRIRLQIDASLSGEIVEIGSGSGILKQQIPGVISTDFFFSPWLDVVCDGYELPFQDGSLSHLILFDVFHHLAAPGLFMKEASRVLVRGGLAILFEPYISLSSWLVYDVFHKEPVGWRERIELGDQAKPTGYYAAQGNATRLFFIDRNSAWPAGWTLERAEAIACFGYFLSGGFSGPTLAGLSWWPALQTIDRILTRWPRLFGGRCLIVLRRNETSANCQTLH